MNELLSRGVDKIIGQEELEAALAGSRKLRIKFGVDPTRPDIHLGHAVVMRQLKQLQDLGHTVIFLIGDYTTKIGDPSGKSQTRPMLTDIEIEANVQTYLAQVGKILNIKKIEIRRNSEWLKKLKFEDLIRLSSNISVAQLIERDDFKNRLSSGQELALHELLYPLIQAYDSVALEADVEFGGSDQLFNLLAGRALQKKLGQQPQIVFISELLVGTDGVRKMSKSYDNYIAITDQPVDMYGKVMSLPDALIAPYYKLCTDIALPIIEDLVANFAAGANPRDSKASLAREIVRTYHGEPAALAAESAWNQTYRDHAGPTKDQIVEIKVGTAPGTLSDVTAAHELVSSRTELRRLVDQKGIRVNDEPVADIGMDLKVGDSLNIGKTRFYKLVAK